MLKKVIGYIIALGIGILVGIFVIPTSPSQIDAIYKQELDSLNTLINNNSQKIKEQDIRITNFELKSNKLDSQNIIFENKLKKLFKNAQTKINNVDNLSNDSLYSEISERYNKK